MLSCELDEFSSVIATLSRNLMTSNIEKPDPAKMITPMKLFWLTICIQVDLHRNSDDDHKRNENQNEPISTVKKDTKC